MIHPVIIQRKREEEARQEYGVPLHIPAPPPPDDPIWDRIREERGITEQQERGAEDIDFRL